MRISVVFVQIVLVCSAFALVVQPAIAAPTCEWFPSSSCPAPGATRTSPCYVDQIKADWNTGWYHRPEQMSYGTAGAGAYPEVWCFDYERDAINYGFRRAAR